MAACPDEQKRVQNVTPYRGGPYPTKAEADAAIAAAMHLCAEAATSLCQGDCGTGETCQLALDEWAPGAVVGPFYAKPGGPGQGWYFRIPTGAWITYHCECLPARPTPISAGGGSHTHTGGTTHGGGLTAAEAEALAGLPPDARDVYLAMKANAGAAWHCTPDEWVRRYNACRASGAGVAVCAALTSASCYLG